MNKIKCTEVTVGRRKINVYNRGSNLKFYYYVVEEMQRSLIGGSGGGTDRFNDDEDVPSVDLARYLRDR